MNVSAATTEIEYLHFHLFCGLGGGAKGFNRGRARVGNLSARYRCIGGIDNDPAAIRDFERAAGVAGSAIDLFNRDQYRDFHGREPPADWREATADDIRRAAHYERPHVVFLSAPCKGFSGLLPEKASTTAKYQALNGLTLRGVWLMLEAWKDDPVELILFENVPRIQKRGRHLLDQIMALLRAYGYEVAETTHDCGEIGGLGQSRKRFLLVARHRAKVPPFLYQPDKHRLRGVGEIIGKLPVPGDLRAGPMHRMPALQWKTWVRLAFVEAGSDWRSLNRLAIEDGVLRDFGIMPDRPWQNGVLGVQRWDEPSGVVTSRGAPTTGNFAVADPRFETGGGGDGYQQFGVRDWREPTGAVINVKSPGQGTFSVADPRVEGPRFNNIFRIVPWQGSSPAVAGPGGPAGGLAVADPRPATDADRAHVKYRVTAYDEAAGTVIAASTTGNGAFAVADPRPGKPTEDLQGNWHVAHFDQPSHAVVGARKSGASAVADPRPTHGPNAHQNKMAVVDWDGPSKTVTGSDRVGSGALSVADPRPAGLNASREHYENGGHYGVVPWEDHAGAVPAFAKHDRGHWSVADPRNVEPEPIEALPAPDDRLVAVIRALDGTWHRPFTTLELAALQSLFDPDEEFALDGNSDAAWRERIGNAVPPDAAEAIACEMATTLLLAASGTTFTLSSRPIWVRQIAMALAVDQTGNIPEGAWLV